MSTTTVRERRDSPSRPDRRRWLPVSDLEFVGCDARPMTVAEFENLDEHDGRVEFFDSESELAWMACEGPGPGHETPREILGQLVDRISQVRGTPIRCLGESQLRLFDAGAGRFRAVHPDKLLFLGKDFKSPRDFPFLAVGEGPYPDVVLEVDHTTDVRRNRLRLYEEWRFPEVWVEVPDAYSPSRPRGRKSGLDIYLLRDGRYARSPESRAFPGWRATEIHRALNEDFVSAETVAVLDRVGRVLGEREGTGPDDDLWLGGFAREWRAEGRADGRAEAAGILLRQRGIRLPAAFPGGLPPADRAALRRAAPETLLGAAAAAATLADFFARVRSAQSAARAPASKTDLS